MRKLRGDFRDIFYSFGIALDFKKMFLALIGVVLTLIIVGFAGLALSWHIIGEVISDKSKIGDKDVRILKNQYEGKGFKHYFRMRSSEANEQGKRLLKWDLAVPYYTLIKASLWDPAKFVLTQPRTVVSARWKVLYPIIMILLLTIIWSYFGGAITRLASFRFAKDEGLDLKKALSFASNKYGSYFWSIWACILAFLFFFACIFIVVLIGHGLYALWSPLGYIALAVMLILLPLALLAGFLMVLIAIGGIFGWPLFSPAISSEGTDAFDGISRGFSYVYSRPWHYAFYNIIGLAYGVVSVLFVWICTYALTYLTLYAAYLGLGGHNYFGAKFGKFIDNLVASTYFGPETNANFGDIVCYVIFGIWMFFLLGFALSYAISYCYTYKTIIYFLLRKKVDGYEMEEIYEEAEEEELPPTETKPPEPQPTSTQPSGTTP